ncbi:hypothetical protein RirG_210140 [Rhizophagus irregularis DAOM 197198w]|uniref:Ion transport domain-containing protein n=1 Tax=Rhizophagus irregularis (strain DAOM 197198w) TaxID=1432141 RepID=A0A015JQ21_RHIIW|nr:hypothetical protein RirG_210140 [Rhizophagus irregularis DAOM 197198w]
MSQMDEIALEIDNIDNDKPHSDNPVTKIGKPHSGKPITKIEVSPNEIYLVTYSHEDHSIVGWNIKDIDEGPLKLEKTVKLNDISEEDNFDLHSMCVSNNKEIVYISKNRTLKIYDMNNDQKIKLNWGNRKSYDYCTFNLKGVLILYNDEYKKFLFYSMQTKNNEWSFIETLPISTYFEDFRLISISYQNSTKILVIDENIDENIRKNIRIIGNKKFICTRIKDKISIYSVELKIPVASLNLNNDIQLSMLDKYPTLCSLLFPLFINITSNGFSDSIMKNYWKKCLCHLKQNDLLPKESYPSIIQATSKHVFGFIDGNVWKIDLEKMMTNEEYDNDFKTNEEMSKMYDHLHILLLDSYMDTVRELFQEAITNYNSKYELNSSQNSIEWRITCKDYKIELHVFKNNVSICTRGVKFVELTVGLSLLGFKLINDDIIILTSIGPLIFYFNENDKSISLSYYYYIILNSSSKDNTKLLQIFSKPTLPLPNHDSFKYNVEWILDVKDNKSRLLKYGVVLLKFAINEHKLELIEDIYKKCINRFEEDFNNIIFLSIINSNLPLLDKYYPEYILRYSLETAIIVDSPSYNIVNSLHLSSFQFPQKDFQVKIFYELLIYFWKSFCLVNLIQRLILFLIFIPIHLITIISGLILVILYRIISFINFDFNNVATEKIPSFIFTTPYINFVNYPKDYNWFSELFWPQSSPFIETINSDIYKTWSGEALLNFKWNRYGKRYYIFIWSGYLILLVCFNVAARISQQEYVGIQKELLKISTLFGFIYLSFEVRQFIYNPIKWIRDIGKIYGIKL